MEPITTTAAIGFAGKFLWDRFAAQGDNAVSNFLKCTERAGNKAAKKGELPTNHHLRNASIGALRDAVSMLAASLQQQRGSKSKGGDPVDIWNIGLARLANEVPAKFDSGALVDFHDSDFGFTESELTELFGSGGIALGKMGERLHEKFAAWATEELSESGLTDDPQYLKSIISEGWVPQGKKDKEVAAEDFDPEGKVTLFAAYAWSFRFRLKNVEEVFRIFTANVLADIGADTKELKANLDSFEDYLRDEFGNIWGALDAITKGIRTLIDQVSALDEKFDASQQAIINGIAERLPQMIVADPRTLKKLNKLAEENRLAHGNTHDGLASILEILAGSVESNQSAHEATHQLLLLVIQLLRELLKNLTPTSKRFLHDELPIRPPVSDFAGRTADLEKLESLATSGAIVSGVQGMGGIGKTELARELARRWESKFAENYEIDCLGAGDSPYSSADILERLLRIWHPTSQLPEAADALSSLFHCELAKIKGGVLLLLDNVADLDQIKPLFPLPTGCAALITSRRKFEMAGMKTHDLEEMDLAEAVALLRSITERLDEATATELAIACGCLPKALRLAGEAIAQKPILPAIWLERFRSDRLKHLDEVERALEISLELLDSDADRLAFYHLGVFTASFPRDAAHAVLAEADPETADRRLENLHAICLIDYRFETDRYILHDLAREFAGNCGGDDIQMAAVGRMAIWVKNGLAEAKSQFLEGHDKVKVALGWFDRERPHIEFAQKWANSHWEDESFNESKIALDIVVHLPNAGSEILSFRQHPREQVEWLKTQIKAARKLGRRDIEGAALGNLGMAWVSLGKVRKGIKILEQALKCCRDFGDTRNEGICLGNLGTAWDILGNIDRAIEFHNLQREIALNSGDRTGECNALGNLGIDYDKLCQVQKAIEHYEDALEISREIGDRRGEGAILGNLGIAWKNMGDLKEALKYHEMHSVFASEIGDQQSLCNAFGNLGLTWYMLDQPDKAIVFYKQQMEIALEINNRRSEAIALGNLGLAYYSAGKLDEAISFFTEQIKIAREIGDRRGECTALGNLGLVWNRKGEAEKAIGLFKKQAQLGHEIKDLSNEVAALGNLSQIWHSLGELKNAISYYDQQIKIANRIGDQRFKSYSLWNSAIACNQLGDHKEAIRRAEEAIKIFEATQDPVAPNMRAKLKKWRGG